MDAIRTLIADDDDSIIAGLIKILTLEPGIEIVAVAHDAIEAVQLAREHEPDVAIVDISMPGGGGPAACRGIRESMPSTRVIAHSNYNDRGAVMQMVRVGAIGYLVKGATREEMVSALTRARRGEASLSGDVASLVVQELSAHLREQEQEADRHRQEMAVLRGLAGGDGLDVTYEPIVELARGGIVGVEARPGLKATADGSHPGAGFATWLEAATRLGLRAQLEMAVAEMTLSEPQGVTSDGWVGIDVAPATLLDPAFGAFLERAQDRVLCLEVSGHRTVPDYGELRAALQKMRGPRVLVAVDDAGHGGASLRHIIELQPDLVKLDPWVASHHDRERPAVPVVEAMARLSASVGAGLVVVGIATDADLRAIDGLGAKYGQGALFAPVEVAS